MPRVTSFVALFAIVAVIFALIQIHVAMEYRRWVRRAFDERRRHHLLRLGRSFLLAGNVFFLLSFSVRWVGVYSHPFSKYCILYPAGMFLAVVLTGWFFTIGSLVVRNAVCWTRRGIMLMKRIAAADSTTIALPAEIPVNESRRRFLRLSGYGAVGVSFGAPVIASLTTTRDYQMNRVPLYFKNLPSGLEGFEIAQISDLHSGVYMSRDHMHEIFELAQSYRAQLIVVTGDFVDSNDNEIPQLYDVLPILNAEHGVWGCLGNHDHFATAEKVNAAVVDRGVRMLNNRNETLTINHERLSLIGIDDFGRGSRNFADAESAFVGVPAEAFKILLSHRPDFFPEACARGVDLQLSGHTHGGQVGIEVGPIKLNPVYLVHKYAKGLYVEQRSQIYVNVGVGMVAVPVRLIRPEITLFMLRRG